MRYSSTASFPAHSRVYSSRVSVTIRESMIGDQPAFTLQSWATVITSGLAFDLIRPDTTNTYESLAAARGLPWTTGSRGERDAIVIDAISRRMDDVHALATESARTNYGFALAPGVSAFEEPQPAPESNLPWIHSNLPSPALHSSIPGLGQYRVFVVEVYLGAAVYDVGRSRNPPAVYGSHQPVQLPIPELGGWPRAATLTFSELRAPSIQWRATSATEYLTANAATQVVLRRELSDGAPPPAPPIAPADPGVDLAESVANIASSLNSLSAAVAESRALAAQTAEAVESVRVLVVGLEGTQTDRAVLQSKLEDLARSSEAGRAELGRLIRATPSDMARRAEIFGAGVLANILAG